MPSEMMRVVDQQHSRRMRCVGESSLWVMRRVMRVRVMIEKVIWVKCWVVVGCMVGVG